MFGAQGKPNGTILGNAKKEVAEWKFAQMDEDRDGVLVKREMTRFRESIRRVLRPRKCGKSFLRYCDQDSDKRISSKEWSSCLGVTENSKMLNNDFSAFLLVNLNFSILQSVLQINI